MDSINQGLFSILFELKIDFERLVVARRIRLTSGPNPHEHIGHFFTLSDTQPTLTTGYPVYRVQFQAVRSQTKLGTI